MWTRCARVEICRFKILGGLRVAKPQTVELVWFEGSQIISRQEKALKSGGCK